MRKKPQSVDGFVPRYPGRSIGDIHKTSLGGADRETTIAPSAESGRKLPAPHNAQAVSKSEVDESLREIGNDEAKPRRRGLFRRRGAKKPLTRKQKIIRWTLRIVIIMALLLAAYVGYKAFLSGSSIFKGNIFDLIQSRPLKTDENGRTNILIYGTSGSFDDRRHEGAGLTDTLMVLSIHQEKKNAYMFNIPRDFYVDYGAACLAGYQGKINAMYECHTGGETSEEADTKGARALQKKFKEITGLTFQYYAHINWAVVVSAINAVGGVEVNVKGNGTCAAFGMPEGSVVDNNMKIRLTPGKHTMKGDEALRFSRARGSAGGCGLDRGDFDRQINQQKVLKALQAKATSAGTLTNVGKVTGLMDAMGQNLRTDFEMAEVRTLMSLARDIPSGSVKSIDLVDEKNQLIVSGNIPGAGSTQVPRAGNFDYSEIHRFLDKKLNASEVSREDAHVALFNASGVEGYAGQQQERLEKQGMNITAAQNAPTGSYSKIELYDLKGKKPATKAKLQSIYGVTATTGNPPFAVTGDTHFVVIFGQTSSAN